MNEEKKVSITVEELDNLCLKIKDKRAEIDAKKDELSELNGHLEELSITAVAALKELDRKNFQSKHGTITRKEQWYVNMPKDLNAKRELFEYLKERGVFEDFATVNHNTLNSFFTEEWEAAEAKGPDAIVEFSIPGLEAPKCRESLGFTKK